MAIKFSLKFWAKLVKQGLLKEVLAMLRRAVKLENPIYRKLDWNSQNRTELVKYLEKQMKSKKALAIYKNNISKLKGKNDDAIVKFWQEWMLTKVTWVSDWDKYKTLERWEDLDVALEGSQNKKYTFDCETGATLQYVLCRHSGVPEDVLIIWAGDVKASTTAPEGGHVWLEYNRSVDGAPVKVDWCYLPDTGEISHMQHAALVKHIKRRWWGFHELGYYKQHQGSIYY